MTEEQTIEKDEDVDNETDVDNDADETEGEENSSPSKWEQNRSPILCFVFVLLLAFVLMNLHLVAMFPNYQALNAITNRDLQSAQWWIDVAQKISPYNSESQFLLARIERRNGNLDAAAEHLALAEDLGGNPQRIESGKKMIDVQRGNLGNGEADFSKMLNDAPWDMYDIYESWIVGCMTKHEYAYARLLVQQWMNQIQDHEKDNGTPYYYMARLWEKFDEFNYAEDDFRRAIQRDPRYYQAYVGLGDVLAKTKNYEEAIESYEVAMSGSPNVVAAAKVGQAHCYRTTGELEKARSLVESVLKDRPEMKDAAIELGQLEVADKNYEAACELIEPHVTEKSRDYDLLDMYAGALKLAGRTTDGEKYAKRAEDGKFALNRIRLLNQQLGSNPNDVQRRFDLALNHLNFGTAPIGLQGLQDIVGENPSHLASLEALAEYYEANQDEVADYKVLAVETRERLDRERELAEQAKQNAKQPPPSAPNNPPGNETEPESNGADSDKKESTDSPKKDS